MIAFSDNPIGVKQLINISKKIDEDSFYIGGDDVAIRHCAATDEIDNNTIIWLRDPDHITRILLCQIEKCLGAVVVCNIETKTAILSVCKEPKVGWIVTDVPRDVFFAIIDECQLIENRKIVHCRRNSVVESHNIGEGVCVGANCYIGPDVVIGNYVVIHNNVVIECPTVIGDYCNLYSGVVIGSSGFGYYNQGEVKKQIPHLMGVKIGHHVDIGAGTCIDRGCLVDTVIGDYVKIDNLVHVAHNVIIGDHSMVVAQSMLGGSSKYGERVYIAPGARVFDNITIGDNVTVGVGAVVKDSVGVGKTVVGIPAHEIKRD